jgi:hypothetical protein
MILKLLLDCALPLVVDNLILIYHNRKSVSIPWEKIFDKISLTNIIEVIPFFLHVNVSIFAQCAKLTYVNIQIYLLGSVRVSAPPLRAPLSKTKVGEKKLMFFQRGILHISGVYSYFFAIYPFFSAEVTNGPGNWRQKSYFPGC